MLKKTAIILFVVFVLFLLAAIGCIWYSRSLINELKNESIEVLQSAQSVDALREAVEPLGIFITLPDNSWIAIRYKDRHVFLIPSSAVALDSSGRWFASSYHFCGQFQIYRSMEKRNMDMLALYEKIGAQHKTLAEMVNEDVKKNAEIRYIHNILTSEDLAAARRHLLTSHFHEIEVN